MNMFHFRLLILTSVLFFIACGQVNSQYREAVANINLSYLYNQNNSFSISAYSFTNKDSTSAILNIAGSNNVNAFEISYYETNNLEQSPDATTPLKATVNKGRISASVDIKDIKANYIVFIIQDLKTINAYVYPFFIPSKRIDTSIQPTVGANNIPVVDKYVPVEKSMKFTSKKSKTDSLFINYYQHYFNPASPPMSLSQQLSKQLTISDQYSVGVNKPIKLHKEGLYYIQNDSTSDSGIALRVQDSSFPRLKGIQQLIETSIYLCSKAEYETLTSSLDKKNSFEQFWLRVTNSEVLAKRVIKHYYANVTKANKLFTSYKEGWKTDMGMIYIIFGPPDQVYKKNNIEQWQYDKTSEYSKTTFEFIRLENTFSDSHYVLQRRAEYKPTWFRLVDLWRKGRKEM